MPTSESLKPVVDFVRKYSELQEAHTKGTRRDASGWTSITLEWGKQNSAKEQMVSLEAALQREFPTETNVFGAVKLLELVSQITGEIRIQARAATYTPTRGRNAGMVQNTTVHDVFFPGASTRKLYDPFAPVEPVDKPIAK